jgi:hypothetical protein
MALEWRVYGCDVMKPLCCCDEMFNVGLFQYVIPMVRVV